MAIVTINEDWRINIDTMNHTLERWTLGGVPLKGDKGKVSESRWAFVGYFPNIQQCLRAAVKHEATLLSDTDLNGYITRLESLDTIFKEQVKQKGEKV